MRAMGPGRLVAWSARLAREAELARTAEEEEDEVEESVVEA